MSKERSEVVLSIVQYLEELSKDLDEDNAESVGVAIECLGQLVPEDFSGTPFNLLDAIRAGRSAQPAPAKAPSPAPKRAADPVAPVSGAIPFDKFINILKAKRFFENVEEGTSEYDERLEKARVSYNQRFPDNKVDANDLESLRQSAEERKAGALDFKNKGNGFLKTRDFKQAIEMYTKAIELDDSNPIFFANRSAAYAYIKEYQLAADDGKSATTRDPAYAKGYSRLGLAEYELGNYEASKQAYTEAKDRSDAESALSKNAEQGIEKCQKRLDALVTTSSSAAPTNAGMPDMSGLASMLGGLGGGGGGGGMPDMGAMMNNPMMAGMMQNLMKDPNMMNNVMKAMGNPQMQNMMKSMMGGSDGNGPDMELMGKLMKLQQNPALLMQVMNSDRIKALEQDPELAAILARARSMDMSALKELMGKPEVVQALKDALDECEG